MWQNRFTILFTLPVFRRHFTKIWSVGKFTFLTAHIRVQGTRVKGDVLKMYPALLQETSQIQ